MYLSIHATLVASEKKTSFLFTHQLVLSSLITKLLIGYNNGRLPLLFSSLFGIGCSCNLLTFSIISHFQNNCKYFFALFLTFSSLTGVKIFKKLSMSPLYAYFYKILILPRQEAPDIFKEGWLIRRQNCFIGYFRFTGWLFRGGISSSWRNLFGRN